MPADGISVFLLAPDKAPPEAGKREPSLGDGAVDIHGRIWFVGETAQSGRPLTPPSPSAADIFQHVEELGYGTLPAVVASTAGSDLVVRYYPGGLTLDEFVQLDLGGEKVTPDHVREILDYMADRIFITPDAQVTHGSTIWADPERFWTAEKSEAILQSHMKTALTMALVDCNIRHEQPTALGRVDLEIEQRSTIDPTAWWRPLEIEVKVLRERGSKGRPKGDLFNNRWVRRGVKQAAAYRDDRGADAGMLCCFDMRSTDRAENFCPQEILATAESLEVEMYRKFLYHSSEAYRTALYGP
jgi:hypothetical protein